MRIALLFLFLLAAPAQAVDPPAFSTSNTRYGLNHATWTGTVVDDGSGKYALRYTSNGSQIDAQVYGPSPFGTPQLNTALAAKVGQSVSVIGANCVRSATERLVIAVDYAGQPASWSLPIYDVQVLVVDDGGGKFSGQVVSGGNTLTWPIYAQASGAITPLSGLVGQVVTIRCSVLARGNPTDFNDRSFVLYKVNP